MLQLIYFVSCSVWHNQLFCVLFCFTHPAVCVLLCFTQSAVLCLALFHSSAVLYLALLHSISCFVTCSVSLNQLCPEVILHLNSHQFENVHQISPAVLLWYSYCQLPFILGSEETTHVTRAPLQPTLVNELTLAITRKFKQLNSLKKIFLVLDWNLRREGRVYSSLHQAADHVGEQFAAKSHSLTLQTHLLQTRGKNDDQLCRVLLLSCWEWYQDRENKWMNEWINKYEISRVPTLQKAKSTL